MSDVKNSDIQTSLLDAVNICLSCIGETAVSAVNNTATNVVLSKQLITEVRNDVLSKGWWFNTDSSGDISIYTNAGVGHGETFNGDIPEEARRYIAIRSARIFQSRFVGSEELLKFSYNEEQVSLAILTQAHVRNGGNSTSFTSFPAEVKALGIEEVMFLQQSAEEKLLTLRLGTELANIDKIKEETKLITSQELKVDADTANIEEQTKLVTAQELKTDAETANVEEQTKLITSQELKTDEETELIKAQELKTDAESELIKDQEAKTVSEKNLIDSQRAQLIAETAVGAQAESTFFTGVKAGTQNTYRDFGAEMRMMGIQETAFQALPAYKKIELIKDATKLRTSTATASSTDQGEIDSVNRILRLIGEPSVSSLSTNSLSSEVVRYLRDTSTEMQGRGWWFNTEKDVELVSGTNLQAAEITLTDAGDEFPNHDGGTGLYLLNPEIENSSESNPLGASGTWKNFNNAYTLRSVADNQDGNKDNAKPHRWRLRDANQSNPDLYSLGSATPVTYPWDADWGTNASKVSVKQASVIDVPANALSVEPNEYKATIRTYPRLTYKTAFGGGGVRTNTYSTMNVGYLYNLEKHTHTFPSKIKAQIIYERLLPECPQKFREFLEVRVALLITELYPQGSLDVERLRKLERELETYFRDRQNNQANYTMFDNYDTATILGVNRPQTIL